MKSANGTAIRAAGMLAACLALAPCNNGSGLDEREVTINSALASDYVVTRSNGVQVARGETNCDGASCTELILPT